MLAERDDYDRMAGAFGETARGRWFLGEVARRARATETSVLLDAVRRLERSVGPKADAASSRVPDDAARTGAVEQAAEAIRQTVWVMRETGADPRLCEKLERLVATIEAACRIAADGLGPSPETGEVGADGARFAARATNGVPQQGRRLLP